MRVLPFCVLSVLLAPALCAQELFVDVGRGNDSNPGTAARPVKSITRAVGLAGNGTTISVLAGVYGTATSGEKFPIQVGGSPQNGVVIRGIGNVVVDMNKSTSTAIAIRAGAKGGRLTGITFRNSDRQQKNWWTRVVEGGSFNGPSTADDFEIDRCVFDTVNRGIVLWNTITPAKGWRIHHNLFVNLGNDAINVFEKQGGNDVFNNTIVGRSNGPNFVGILVESPAARIHNNLVVGMRDAFLTGQATVPGSFVANDAWQNQRAFAGKITSPPPGNFTVDPQFVDPTKGDYRLKSGSPLIEKGSAAIAQRADLDANPGAVDADRNGSILPDVGVFELPVTRLTTTYDSKTGALKLSMTGPRGLLGFVLFAAEDGLVQIPGVGPVLLDLATLAPVTTPPALFPVTINTTVQPQPPGTRVVMQGVAYDPSKPMLLPGNQAWLQW